MRIVVLKSCDTCRKALRELTAAGVTPEVTDLRTDGLAREEIAEILSDVGETALNRRSTTWRGLSDAERAGDPVDLIARHPTLLKRPAVHHDGRWSVGWDAGVRNRLGLG